MVYMDAYADACSLMFCAIGLVWESARDKKQWQRSAHLFRHKSSILLLIQPAFRHEHAVATRCDMDQYALIDDCTIQNWQRPTKDMTLSTFPQAGSVIFW